MKGHSSHIAVGAGVRQADRLGERLRVANARRSRLLVIYLTLGDPWTTHSVATAAVEAGADALELGIPTPGTNPRGADVAESFKRAGDLAPQRAFGLLRELRAALPGTPLLPLVYPQTLADLGRDWLISASIESGADGLVLTRPSGRPELDLIVSSGLSAIPVIPPGNDAAQRVLEAGADRLTYRTLAPTTGARLDRPAAGRLTRGLATVATKPFLVGFGIRGEQDIRTVARHAAGIVIGSQVHRVLAASAPADRMRTLRSAIQGWKAATVLTDPDRDRDR